MVYCRVCQCAYGLRADRRGVCFLNLDLHMLCLWLGCCLCSKRWGGFGGEKLRLFLFIFVSALLVTLVITCVYNFHI